MTLHYAQKFWVGLAMRRPIKSSCRARSTPFYLIRCEQRASQVQLVHLLREVSLLTGALLFVVFACVCHGQLVSRKHIARNKPAPLACAILPRQFWGLAGAVGAFLRWALRATSILVHHLQTSLASGHVVVCPWSLSVMH